MDGRGRWMDVVFIERQWRSLKYECVYQNARNLGSPSRDRPLRSLYNRETSLGARWGAAGGSLA